MLLTIIAFLVVLGILVFVHELGHFLAAKWSKIKVLEFAIGFPPRILSFKKGETQYTIGALPFGGYVKMLGEDESSKDPRAFNNQSAGKRFLVGIAGVLMNVVLAWLILTILFSVGTTPIVTPSNQIGGEKIESQIFIAQIQKDSPADKASLAAGDQLVSGRSQEENVQFDSTEQVSQFTSKNINKEVVFVVKREGKTLEKPVVIGDDKSAPLGVSIVDQAKVRVAWYQAPYVALVETGRIIQVTFEFLGNFFKTLFVSGKVSDEVGGPVAIFNLSGVAARAGAVVLFQFIAMLSINLALINILPFPALDGGRLLFIILEKIAGKKVVKEEIEGIIHTVGFALLILLILAVTYKDILRLIQK